MGWKLHVAGAAIDRADHPGSQMEIAREEDERAPLPPSIRPGAAELDRVHAATSNGEGAEPGGEGTGR